MIQQTKKTSFQKKRKGREGIARLIYDFKRYSVRDVAGGDINRKQEEKLRLLWEKAEELWNMTRNSQEKWKISETRTI